MSPFSQFLFTSGVENLRMIAQPTQTELHEMDSDMAQVPPFRLSVEEVDRLAGIEAENRTEAQRNCPTRIQRHE